MDSNPTFRAKKSPVKSGLFICLFGLGITLVCHFYGMAFGISTHFYPLNWTARCTHLPTFIPYWNLRNFACRVSVEAWTTFNDIARNRSFAIISCDDQCFLCVPSIYWFELSRPRASLACLRIRNCVRAIPTKRILFLKLVNRFQHTSP